MIMKIARCALVTGAAFLGAFARDFFLMDETLWFGASAAGLVAFVFMAWSAD